MLAGSVKLEPEAAERRIFGLLPTGTIDLMARRNDIDRLRSEMEELFADLCQVPRLVAPRRGFRPRVDVYRSDEPPTLTIVVELAGIDPGEIELAVADGMFVLRGKRRRDAGQGRTYQHMEIDYGPFERRIALDEPVDSEAADATYERGLLTIRLPVTKRASGPVRVTVTRERA